ncbi:MAG TPA: hypothetical protein VK456_16210, partial [Xanthobacteraceae bacterium]|nr:hypothetical protein [Xanthobacteraceae bacterium]
RVESASKSVADAARETVEDNFIEIGPKVPVAFPRPFLLATDSAGVSRKSHRRHEWRLNELRQ